VGWTGDANVLWDAAAFNMDVDAFTRRFMADVRDAQADDGAFRDFSPAAYRPAVPAGASPGWADAGICLPWTVWQRYGDTEIIRENWRAMSRYLTFIADSNPDFIWRHGRGTDFGDWLALDAKDPGDPTTPKDLIGTAFWAHSLDCMAQMGEAVDQGAQAQSYRDMWIRVRSAFQGEFVHADGRVGNGSQTGYLLALRYGLILDEMRAATVAHIVTDIKRRGTLLSTGFLGTPISLDVLADAGYVQLAYDLLLRTEFPSWGYMVARGATTIWERWNGDTGDVSMNSFNHYALGAVCGFLFRRLAGIAPLEPGFRKIEVHPLLDSRVKSGGGRYHSVLGLIATRWRQQDGGGFELALTVPPNASAVVHLPAPPACTIEEGGAPIAARADIREIRRTLDQAIITVGSGSFRFSVAESIRRDEEVGGSSKC
jgi:alpha-L-rhamnosidase